MPTIHNVLYWPKNLRDRVRHVSQQFQQEELKRNLAETDLRDVIIVCVAEALPKVEKTTLEQFKQRVNELKGKG
jgi:hypothetical protein